ncbi:MAG: HAMP domain-containing protein [Chloroflexi bacterium]|nr:HAMP domain-containing protein [Chloroflexota bacterium]
MALNETVKRALAAGSAVLRNMRRFTRSALSALPTKLQRGLAARLVIGTNILIMAALIAFAIITGTLLRSRMFRSVDFDLTHHSRTYGALVQQDIQFLLEEAVVIGNSDALEPALVTRSGSTLRRILRPFSLSHEFDTAYVLGADGEVLARTGDSITDPERIGLLPILTYAAQNETRVDLFEVDGVLWMAASAVHRTRTDKRLDAFILLGQRVDAHYLKSLRNMLGPDLALSAQGRIVHTFEVTPADAPLSLPGDPLTGAEYVRNALGYRTLSIGGSDFRAAGSTTTTRDGTPLNLYVFQDINPVNDALRAALWQVIAIAAGLAALGSLASVAFAHRVVRPLEQLAVSAQAISRGEFDQPVDTHADDEVGQLALAFEQMRTRVRSMMAEQQAWAAELEGRVQAGTAEIRALGEQQDQLLHRVITAREEENRRVARELHDETSQNLAALIALTGAARDLPPDEAKARIADLRPLLADTLQGIKHIMLNLRPALLDDHGLVPALRWHAHERLDPLGVAVRIRMAGVERRLPAELENCLFRIGQEALTNIARHAGARRAELSFEFSGDDAHPAVSMTIADDGRGFDPARVPAPGAAARAHLGLLGMRERADLIGARVDIDSAPGAGTRVRVHAEAGALVKEHE